MALSELLGILSLSVTVIIGLVLFLGRKLNRARVNGEDQVPSGSIDGPCRVKIISQRNNIIFNEETNRAGVQWISDYKEISYHRIDGKEVVILAEGFLPIFEEL